MIFLGGIASLVLLGILRGYVLSVLWGWFVQAQFKAPALRIPQALGIAAMVTLLTYQRNDREHKFTEDVLTGFAASSVALGLGYVYHLFL